MKVSDVNKLILLLLIVIPTFVHAQDVGNEEYMCNATMLNVRSGPNVSSQALFKLKQFEFITLVEKTRKESTIDGHKAIWYKIKNSKGQSGFTFSYYLSKIPKYKHLIGGNPHSYQDYIKSDEGGMLKNAYGYSTFKFIDSEDFSLLIFEKQIDKENNIWEVIDLKIIPEQYGWWGDASYSFQYTKKGKEYLRNNDGELKVLYPLSDNRQGSHVEIEPLVVYFLDFNENKIQTVPNDFVKGCGHDTYAYD